VLVRAAPFYRSIGEEGINMAADNPVVQFCGYLSGALTLVVVLVLVQLASPLIYLVLASVWWLAAHAWCLWLC
jgi:type IV secretory pathway TrbD component